VVNALSSMSSLAQLERTHPVLHFSSPKVVFLSADPARGSFGPEKPKTRLLKGTTASDALFSIREELFAGEFEGSECCRVTALRV